MSAIPGSAMGVSRGSEETTSPVKISAEANDALVAANSVMTSGLTASDGVLPATVARTDLMVPSREAAASVPSGRKPTLLQ